ncbi:recombinase RecB [Spirochaetia bacterium]|nr:recombinase RecB [Spirochaetia bacterium]
MLGIYCRTSLAVENDGVSTIDQQFKAGMDFAKAKGWEFKVYQDEGKSGYKIDDDDPFKNRPGLINLLADIKSGIITNVWVWEQSRLSRNQLATAHIYAIFQKNKIILYDKDKEYDVNNSQVKMIMTILGSVAEYERNQIVSRITRGLQDRINMGKRTHANIYGYKKIGKDDKGYAKIEPVKSEIEKIKIVFDDYLKGNTIKSIALKLHGKGPSVKYDLSSNQRIRHILEHFEYTGYSLNMKGIELLRKFDNFEIDTIAELNDNQYFNASQSYTEKLVSVENWIKVRERLRINRKIYQEKPQTRAASNAIATGLVKCGFCNSTFYCLNIKRKKTLKSGEVRIYDNLGYHHHVKISRQECYQYPKSLKVEKIDSLFRLFFFYFYLVFDNTKELIEAAQKEIKIRMEELKESVKTGEKEVSSIKKQIKKFNDAIESDDVDTATIIRLEKRITDLELREKDKSQELENNRILLEQERGKYDSNEKKNAYYNTKDKIFGFLEADIETQRNELRQIVDECFVYENYLAIVANKRFFVFDINGTTNFNEWTMKLLSNDEVFLPNFVKDDKETFDNYVFDLEARFLNDATIEKIDLSLDDNRENIQEEIYDNNIIYDLRDIEYFIYLKKD